MKQLKVINLYNHAPITIKLLTRIGAIPANWSRWHEIYRDFQNYGVAKTSQLHHCSTRECYRARDAMESTVVLNIDDNKKIHDELKGLVELFT